MIAIFSVALPPGDKRRGAGLSAASTHGLPNGATPAYAGLLGEREEPAAQIHPDCGHAGQAHPQRRQPKGGHQQHTVHWVSPHVPPTAERVKSPPSGKS